MNTEQLIRALGGADAICKPGCTCRGSYTGPERRSVHRDATTRCHWWDRMFGDQCVLTEGHDGEHKSPWHPCPVEGCDLFGPHDLHRDSEGFEWRQVTA